MAQQHRTDRRPHHLFSWLSNTDVAAIQVLNAKDETVLYLADPHLLESQIERQLRERGLSGELKLVPCDDARNPVGPKAIRMVIEQRAGVSARDLFRRASPSPSLRAPVGPGGQGASTQIDPIALIERTDTLAEKARASEREQLERLAERERDMMATLSQTQIETARSAAEAERLAAKQAIEAQQRASESSRGLYEELLKINALQATTTMANVKEAHAQANAAQMQAAAQLQQSLQTQLDDARRENMQLRNEVMQLTGELRSASNDRTTTYNAVAAEVRAEFARDVESKNRAIEALQERVDRLSRELAEKAGELSAAKLTAAHNEALLKQQIEVVKLTASDSAELNRQLKTLDVLMRAPADKAKLAMAVMGIDDPDPSSPEPEQNGLERTVQAVSGIIDRVMPAFTAARNAGSAPIVPALPPGEGDSL